MEIPAGESLSQGNCNQGSQVLNEARVRSLPVGWAGWTSRRNGGLSLIILIISVVVINNCSAQTHGRRACFLPFP